MNVTLPRTLNGVTLTTQHPLILSDSQSIHAILQDSENIAVLGIKPESRAGQPAYDVPAYMKEKGYHLIPVPTYYPEVTSILGEPVVRDMKTIVQRVDILNVFRRSEDVPAHIEDIIALKPRVVWLQRGIEHHEMALKLAAHGIQVVQNKCIMVEHRNANIHKAL